MFALGWDPELRNRKCWLYLWLRYTANRPGPPSVINLIDGVLSVCFLLQGNNSVLCVSSCVSSCGLIVCIFVRCARDKAGYYNSFSFPKKDASPSAECFLFVFWSTRKNVGSLLLMILVQSHDKKNKIMAAFRSALRRFRRQNFTSEGAPLRRFPRQNTTSEGVPPKQTKREKPRQLEKTSSGPRRPPKERESSLANKNIRP